MSDGQIKMKIDAYGRPTIEAVGFSGSSCTAATAGIEKALAGNEGDAVKVLKPEYYQTGEAETEVHQGLGQNW